jgi:alpha-mannosidase
MKRLAVPALLLASVLRAQTAAPAAWKPVLDRLQSITVLALPEWRSHADVPHPEAAAPEDSGWRVVKTGERWKGSRVLRRSIETPEKISGYEIRGARVKLDLNIRSDEAETLTVFSNGSIVARTDGDMQQPITLTETAEPGQKFLIAVRVDANDVNTWIQRSALMVEPPAGRPDPGLLRTEILSAVPLVAAFAEGRNAREQTLAEAVSSIDLGALERGDQTAFDSSLREAQETLQTLDPWMKRFTIVATGNSHIDMAWLWPWTETVEVVRNTFRSALDLMREYPGFTFTMSSAQAYAWMEEKYPELFREIQQRVKEGRWEIVGGMWVEPDLNLPTGESLVRQVLIGKRYFQQKFGVDVKIGWNPDSFGYNWQLPQIYKKCGMDYFVTQKIYWNDTTQFPHKLFWWEAPDGSRILTYFPHDYANGIDPPKMTEDLAAYAPALGGEMMHLYGVGDHGGGPTRAMLDEALRLQAPGTVFPKLRFGTGTGFFDDMQKRLASLHVPTWRDELYLEFHRGVQTTQAETKKRIRKDEELLLEAEKFSSLASLGGAAYPGPVLERAWKRLLFDEFHDIMPGSGIAQNYVDARRNLRDVARAGGEALDGALESIASHADTRGPGVPVVVFNPLSWPRTEVVEVEAQLPAPAHGVAVVDSADKPVESQMLGWDHATNRVRLLVEASVPALGYRAYHVVGNAHPSVAAGGVEATTDSLENQFVRVKIDPESGCMTSLFDKRSGTEALAAAETDSGGPKDRVCGNLLQTFVDKPKQWDAWNIDADFEQDRWDLDHADEVKLVESGPLRAVIRVKTHFQNSAFVQDITLDAGSPRVDVKTQADWHEKHILLKVAFPLSAHNDRATFEIPYGSIERPTTRRTPAEKAKFEVPALRWADLSDGTHGFSLLNDCKYGYDAKGNVLRLSLLRSPTWPDAHADEGRHEFTYSLYPHAGGWREAETVRRGYELNCPLLPVASWTHPGPLPAERAFLGVAEDNVVVTAVKEAEDGDGIVIRFYEWAGRKSDIHVRLPQAAASVNETDLMERPVRALPLNAGGTEVAVPTGPYEIKTLKVTFAKGS